jgi:hypothetical protein
MLKWRAKSVRARGKAKMSKIAVVEELGVVPNKVRSDGIKGTSGNFRSGVQVIYSYHL